MNDDIKKAEKEYQDMKSKMKYAWSSPLVIGFLLSGLLSMVLWKSFDNQYFLGLSMIFGIISIFVYEKRKNDWNKKQDR